MKEPLENSDIPKLDVHVIHEVVVLSLSGAKVLEDALRKKENKMKSEEREVKVSTDSKHLTFCRWYDTYAVYRGDLLLYSCQDANPYPYNPILLKRLGYIVIDLGEIPTHGKPSEFDWTESRGGDNYGWRPPMQLSVLTEQWRQYKERMARELVKKAERELESARLAMDRLLVEYNARLIMDQLLVER